MDAVRHHAPPARAMGGWPDLALGVAGAALLVNVAMIIVVWPDGDEPWAAGQVAIFIAAVVVRVLRPDLAVSAWVAISVLPVALGELCNTTLSAMFEADPPAIAVALVTAISWLAGGFGLATTVELIAAYPDRQIAVGWERRVKAVAWAAPAALAAVMLASPVVPVPSYLDVPDVDNPLHVLPVSVSRGTADLLIGLSFLPVVGGVAILVAHYRRASTDLRRRIRWLLVPFPPLVLGAVLGLGLGDLLFGDSSKTVIWVTYLLLQPAVPIAGAIGILQPAGWDADRVLRRSLVYGVLWTAIVGTLIATAAVAGTAAGRYVPVGWAVTIALMVSLVFQPLRRRLESLAERWVFGERVDHSDVITRLGATLADTFELEQLLPRMVAALEEGLQLTWARVRLRGVDDTTPPDEPVVVVPIDLDGEPLGVVECGPKRDGKWSDDDRSVVSSFARQAALAVRNVRLTEQTARYAADLEVSRSRIALAAESERRRIERNIHDGIQQDLVVLIGMAGRIENEPDAMAMAAGMVELHERLEHVLADLRDLASGIYPTVLSDQGILPAVEALVATHPKPVRLRADAGLRQLRLPDEIEGAAYFTVAEALTNSLKHSNATAVDVTLSRINGALSIEVTDDGVGFDSTSRPAGRGLEGLADRLGALGGTFDVRAEAGRGTAVHASVSITNGERP